jgi:hypothetical protein
MVFGFAKRSADPLESQADREDGRRRSDGRNDDDKWRMSLKKSKPFFTAGMLKISCVAPRQRLKKL